MKINLSKALLNIGLIGALVVTHQAFTQNTVEDLGSLKKLVNSELFNDWKDGNIILLIRHEERCDRSINPCLGPENGITIAGSERATGIGNRLKLHFDLSNTDIFTSPMTRAFQTADAMFSNANQLPDRSTLCGTDIIDKLLQHKTVDRNLLVVTHNTCMNDLTSSSANKNPWNPEYGSMLFAKITHDNTIHIVGKLDPIDFPEEPSPM